MAEYAPAIAGLIGITLVLTSAVVFALMRPSDLPVIDQNGR